MAFIIYTNETTEEGIDLGDPLVVLSVWKEIAALDDSESFSELRGVPLASEEEVSAEWLKEVRKQAQEFLEKHGKRLGPDAHAVLGTLAGSGQPD